MKHVKFILDKKHSMMSREQATEIEKLFKNVYLDFNIDTQVWEMVLIVKLDEEDYFWTWSTQFDKEDRLYYVRLDKMESGSCKTLFALDYGRFKTAEEASAYIETLPEPEEAAAEEAKVFAFI